MSGPGVSGLLALLTACGSHVAAQGDTLALSGKRPPAPLLEDLKARKLEVLAYLQDPAKEDPAALFLPSPATVAPGHGVPVEGMGGEVVSNCDNLGTVPFTETERKAMPDLTDWAVIAAQPGRCGSCAHAQDAPDWGPLMVACTCDPVAWWPLPAPFALHVGARCGAYLQPGATVGQGYRARDAVRPWGQA